MCSKLSHVVVGRPQSLTDCWPKALVPCHLSLSTKLPQCPQDMEMVSHRASGRDRENPRWNPVVLFYNVISEVTCIFLVTQDNLVQRGRGLNRMWAPGGRQRSLEGCIGGWVPQTPPSSLHPSLSTEPLHVPGTMLSTSIIAKKTTASFFCPGTSCFMWKNRY